MNSFSKWFERQTKCKGNDKAFRNRKGMEAAWNAGQIEQRQMSTAAIQPGMDLAGVSEAWQEIIGQACMDATGESDG